VYGLSVTLGWPIDVIGIAGATLTTLCWLPQAFKVIREKETRALSLPATLAFTAGVVLWLIYGLAIEDWPLIGSNAATLALMLPILAMKLRHG
jgi:MtN3 and saliva related transmembrane protein